MKSFKIMVVAAVLAACSSSPKQEATTSEPEDTNNQLTEAQKAEGWTLLFDGKSMDGWKFFKGRPANGWKVENGTLHCVAADSADERNDIMTEKQYTNFELALEWKIANQGNSGIIYRATEEFDQPYQSGPEYQLLDDVGYPGTWTEKNMTAANYDMHAPQNKNLKPVGEWNSTRILVNGNHVEHWLNGSKVVEYELQSEEWKKLKEGSKWKDATGYGMASSGHITLQDHGGEVWFRNIMIKEL
ncbi:MAG: DUF1080 domain-containing protein [Cyclobacteriaceae bacterium]